MYRIPAIAIDVTLAFTNAAPLGPYRGAGRPEALYLIERLIDEAARATGIDRVELRRRNLIPAAAMPYRTAERPGLRQRRVRGDRWTGRWPWPTGQGFPARRRGGSERAGRLRGIGLACFLEVAGGILDEMVELRFDDDGTVALHTGAQPMGQGHLSTFPSADRGAARRRSTRCGSSRATATWCRRARPASPRAPDDGGQRGRAGLRRGHRERPPRWPRTSSRRPPADVEFAAGRFRVKGTDRAIGLLDLAARARALPNLPPELAGGLDSTAKFVSPQMSFPNGCHVTEVEIDPETGAVAVVGYAAVDDVGRIVHETIVEGQIHGGIAQGLGQVLGEHVVYDEHGQLLTASFMDYMLPRADDLPALRVGHHGVPCTTNPLGVKGAGESGVAGALPSAVNAVLDALATPRRARARPADVSGARLGRAPRRALGQRSAGAAPGGAGGARGGTCAGTRSFERSPLDLRWGQQTTRGGFDDPQKPRFPRRCRPAPRRPRRALPRLTAGPRRYPTC